MGAESDTLETVTLPEAPVTPVTTASTASMTVPATTTVATPSTSPRERTFTQAELDAKIGEARTQGRKTAYSYLQKELGVPVLNEAGDITLDQLRALVTQARTQETSASAQLRALLDEKQRLEQTLGEKDSEVKGAYSKAAQMLRLGEAKALAVQLGFNDPKDAVVMLGDLSRFEADVEAGTVAGLHEALTALSTEKPYLLRGALPSTTQAPGATPPPAIPPTPRPADPRAAKQVDDEERREAVRRQAQSYF